MKYKAVISDIDGTITPIVPHAIPSRKATACIKKVVQKGTSFSLASGRPFFLVDYLVKHLGLVSPSILDNGAVITDSNGHTLWEAVLENSKANKILYYLRDYPLFRVSCEDDVLEKPKAVLPTAKVRKISVHDISLQEAERLIKKIEKKHKDLAIMKAASYKGERYIDIYFSDARATKQHAVLEYAGLLGIKTKEIIGIGDGYNDFPLLMACGLKVAMGNAVEEIKAIADYIAPSVEEDGIVDVLNKFLL